MQLELKSIKPGMQTMRPVNVHERRPRRKIPTINVDE